MKSQQVEEYLEEMYRLKERGLEAKTNELAVALGVSPASASEMLKKLESRGFVSRVPYGGAALTLAGEGVGRKITRRHRVIEKFLALLGLRKNLHREACVLEHAVSDEVEKAMAKLVREKDVRKVSEMRRCECGKVVLVAVGGSAKRRLAEMGVVQGTRVVVERASAASGPVELKVKGSSLAVGRGLAEKVFVRKCD
ncbi:TPA: MarR family transcriptional regulator [Candidatus Micrarchaeota archaeon]|nr:MAG: hypothetical protein AUJ65_04935 [Candidatus Micrarchaeota archaeon CG1_02_51_15]HII38626.1 MarR family transcriptional regulator [Candidatus Micrarchaeota archaeon]